MSILQEGVQRQLNADQASEDSLGREAVPVQALSAALQPERQFEQAHEGARRLHDVTQHHGQPRVTPERQIHRVLSHTRHQNWMLHSTTNLYTMKERNDGITMGVLDNKLTLRGNEIKIIYKIYLSSL